MRATTLLAVFCLLCGCALGSREDDDDNNQGSTCTNDQQCTSDKVCNLVTQRCTPRAAAAMNQVRAEFVCPFGDASSSNGGPAYYSWNFGGMQEDLGALCFARSYGSDYATIFIYGGGSTYAVSVELDPTKGTGSYPARTESFVYVDSRGDMPASFAYGVTGAVQITTINENEVRGSLEVGLEEAYPLGGGCAGAPARCGSAGTGIFCNMQDPTGIASCRRTCFGGRMCAAEETCVHNSDGYDLCVPGMGFVGSKCTVHTDCMESRCITGQFGDTEQGYCRSTCDAQGTDFCGDGVHVCVGLMGGGGVCMIEPCALLSCAGGTVCKPSSALEASCVNGGTIGGTFDVTISAPMTGLQGTAQASGMSSAGSFQSDGRAGAFVEMAMDGSRFLTVSVIGTNDLALILQLPEKYARPLASGEGERRFVAQWELGSFLLHENGEGGFDTVATGVAGRASFIAIGTAVDTRVAGAFAIDYEVAEQ